VQINHRPFQCSKDFSKIVIVLAETFNIMVPDIKTLKAELDKDETALL